MKFVIVLFLSLFLVGCAVPVERKFPDVPPKLMEPCTKLTQIDEKNVLITNLMKVVVTNYKHYHECSNRVELWQEWYKTQKQIFESVE